MRVISDASLLLGAITPHSPDYTAAQNERDGNRCAAFVLTFCLFPFMLPYMTSTECWDFLTPCPQYVPCVRKLAASLNPPSPILCGRHTWKPLSTRIPLFVAILLLPLSEGEIIASYGDGLTDTSSFLFPPPSSAFSSPLQTQLFRIFFGGLRFPQGGTALDVTRLLNGKTPWQIGSTAWGF